MPIPPGGAPYKYVCALEGTAMAKVAVDAMTRKMCRIVSPSGIGDRCLAATVSEILNTLTRKLATPLRAMQKATDTARAKTKTIVGPIHNPKFSTELAKMELRGQRLPLAIPIFPICWRTLMIDHANLGGMVYY